MARAIISLPVPVSPRIKTVASVGATVSTARSTPLSEELSPMMPPKSWSRRISASQVLFLFGEMVVEAHDFLIRQRVFHRNRHLGRDLFQQLEFLHRKGVRIDARQIERAKRAAPCHQRDAAQRQQRRRQQRRTILEQAIEIVLAEDSGDARSKRDASG